MEIQQVKQDSSTDRGPSAEIGRVEFGERMRHLRRSRGWTLDETAEQTGISRSGISKIERGQMSPTFTALQKLAKGFDIALEDLLRGETDRMNEPYGQRAVIRAGDGLVRSLPNYSLELLLTDLKRTAFLPYKAKLRSRDISEIEELDRHDSQDFVFVLSGHAVMHTEFFEPKELGPGDCVYFDARMGHAFLSVGDEDAELLCISAFAS